MVQRFAAPTLVIASANPQKLAELAGMLELAGVEVLPLPRGLEIEETGLCYAENARLKAEVVARSEHFALHHLDNGAPDPIVTAMSAASRPFSQEASHAAPLLDRPLGPTRPRTGASFGVIVPKRWAARAVTRNMIKRHARSLAEAALPQRDGAVYLLRLRKAWPKQRFTSAASSAWSDEIRQQLFRLFSGLESRSS